MPKFEVIKSVDAYVRYGTCIEAETAEEAHQIASARDYQGSWIETQVDEFDDTDIFLEDVTELTEEEAHAVYGS